jgi:nucleoside-diphosphate-sugar epimerase
LGAHLLFPGNVYNFGAGMPAVLAPDTPQRPTTGKGRIRVDLEQQLAQAALHHGFAATVIRAGDFFGAGSGSWLDQVIVKKLSAGPRDLARMHGMHRMPGPTCPIWRGPSCVWPRRPRRLLAGATSACTSPATQ